ncbi:MAG: glycosyl transferase [Phyllobacteriaceae bacterium]|nr:glycosyl transferase [Phyllobacteriaceae bacterium]MBA92422.1 glycosyl transferase [Phyllobacteriaceae bacterium]
MHLVFVSSIVPHGTPTTGYEIANAAILSALRRAGARVTVLGYARPGQRPPDDGNSVVLGEIDPTTAHATQFRKAQWLGQAVAAGTTVSSAKLQIAGRAAVERALEGIAPFDGFVLNAVQMAGAYPDLFLSRPALFVAHNVEHVSAEQNAEAAGSPVQRFLFRREARYLRALESRFCRAAAHVLTLSDDDAAVLSREAGHDRFTTLPLVTCTQAPLPVTEEAEYDAGLIGTWTWEPNRIGLDWFLRAVTPHLPDTFTVRIAGSVPDGMPSGHPGTRFVGRVPDAAAFIRHARVVPLAARAGTGVQLKTIETFEHGLPSVATALALRGVARVPDNCVIAGEPKEFAVALVRQARSSVRLDGAAFYAAQLAALDAGVTRALDVFATGAAGRRAA